MYEQRSKKSAFYVINTKFCIYASSLSFIRQVWYFPKQDFNFPRWDFRYFTKLNGVTSQSRFLLKRIWVNTVLFLKPP